MIRCIEIALTIPDNEAETAASTLRRLGLPGIGVSRADLYRFDVGPESVQFGPSDRPVVSGFQIMVTANRCALSSLCRAWPWDRELFRLRRKPRALNDGPWV